MRLHKRVFCICTYCLLFILLLSSCHKQDVQVGTDLAVSHTRVITVDTVTPVFSMYVLDSFATTGKSFALVGNYSDAYVGSTVASAYFQPGLPSLSEDASTLLPQKNAQFDSLVLVFNPSGYFFGDTTKPVALNVYQLSSQPEYTYANQLYNTSSVPLKTLLGSFSKLISPARKDSIHVKFDQTMGQDWFNMIQKKASQFQSEDNFLNYFAGICVQPASDMEAVYGFNLADSSVKLRMYYHLTTPYFVENYIDFYLTRTGYQFNRVVTDRTGTALASTNSRQREFFASSTNPYLVVQNGTGVLLKVKFPSLRNLLQTSEITKLTYAQLIIKPVGGTYDIYQYKLPDPLYLAATDETNNIGSSLADSTGSGIESKSPYIDYLYDVNTSYSFNITSYLNSLISTSGTQEEGFFIMEVDPTSAKSITRGVFGSPYINVAKYQTKLVVNLLTVEE